jgi:hypothetical protein
MKRLLTLTALASALILATAAAPVLANPNGRHGGPAISHIGGGHGHHFGPRYNFTHHFNHHRQHVHIPHHRHWHYWRNRHWHRYGWGVPVAVGVAGVATYAAAAPAPVCTCLTKQYLDNGAVVFTDTCTNETAIAMPPAIK